MFKNLLENKKNYKKIYSILDGKDHILDFNSFLLNKNLRHFNFRYKFNELNLKIFNVNESLDFTYNMYTEDIAFEDGSISLSKNSIYYKKLKKIMKNLSIEIINQDDFLEKINKSREKAAALINKKSIKVKSNYYSIIF